MVLAAVVVSLHLAGVFDASDRAITASLDALEPPPDREAAPLLLAIDSPSVEQLGPPPWSTGTWVRIATALRGAGFAEAWLVDPWTSVTTGEAPPPGSGPAATLHVPRLLFENPEAPGLPQALEPLDILPFSRWDDQLSLPAHRD
ncbi:MAG: hypothetical protein JRJ84_25825, partial [Deltaproteobacteria bacterium]|nr:hypothetical protein [Deltaproteobacteria bacterium]